MIANSRMIPERTGRSGRVAHEELRSRAQGQEVSVAYEENAGYTVFGTSIGRSIMSAKGQRKIRYGGIAVNLRFVSHNATFSQPRQKQQQ